MWPNKRRKFQNSATTITREKHQFTETEPGTEQIVEILHGTENPKLSPQESSTMRAELKQELGLTVDVPLEEWEPDRRINIWGTISQLFTQPRYVGAIAAVAGVALMAIVLVGGTATSTEDLALPAPTAVMETEPTISESSQKTGEDSDSFTSQEPAAEMGATTPAAVGATDSDGGVLRDTQETAEDSINSVKTQVLPIGELILDESGNIVVEKTTVVNFFASWCPPCREELPTFTQLADNYSSQIDFIGIATKDDLAATEQLIAEAGIAYPNYNDPDGTLFTHYNGFGMPTTLIIEPNGNITSHTGTVYYDDFSQQLDTILAQDQ